MNINKKSITIWTLLIAVSIAAGFIVSRATYNYNTAHSISSSETHGFTIKPSSVDELVNESTIIVSGSFGDVINQGEYTHYEDGKLVLANDATPPEMRIPFSDYKVNITEVIDGNIAVNDQVIVRLPGQLDAKTIKKSEKLVFFLTMNSDKVSYGPYYYEQSFVDLTKNKATFADKDASSVKFSNKELTSEEFITEVKQKTKK